MIGLAIDGSSTHMAESHSHHHMIQNGIGRKTWHSVYQPIKPAKSFVQESVEEPADDYKYDDWTGDRWVKYPQGREPFPPPHDPEWYKKEDFWHSIYQPVKPAKQ